MSYILDALKKSEAERSRGVVPTLLTPPQTSFRSGTVGWLVIAALIINAGLVRVVFHTLYRQRAGIDLLINAKVEVSCQAPT